LAWLETLDALERLLGESDYVLISLPLADNTRGLIDAAQLAQMKPDGVIINVGRGRIIDEGALYAALAENRIGGAIIDVWYDYPGPDGVDRPPSQYPFQKLDNLIMTPHFSARSAAMRNRRWAFVAANLDRFARGEVPQNICFKGTG
jgi:phosphoglycerate dehydrogenase-like enzyme